MREDTRTKVIKLRKSNPCMAGAEIARRVGLSRERVRQILGDKNAGIIQHIACLNCGKPIMGSGKNNTKYCSRKCQLESHRVPIVCSVCGQLFTIEQKQLFNRLGYYRKQPRKVDMLFCSKACYGKWWGHTHNRKPSNLDSVRNSATILVK